MSQLIKCPKCNARSWSSDYWYCPSCPYSEVKEEALLEMCSEFKESYSRGDNPTILLNDWMNEQEDLTREMVNECLPKSQYNYVVDCNQDLGYDTWGITEYHENDFNEADLFINRHAETLINHPRYGHLCRREGFIYYVNSRGKVVETKPYTYPIYPPYSGTPCCPCPRPTKIKISNWALQDEGLDGFDDDGYFPTVPHETAHADPSVHRHPNYQPFSSQYSSGPGHDNIHNNKNREFYNKLTSLGYKEKVRTRFKELRKIKGEDNDKYDK